MTSDVKGSPHVIVVGAGVGGLSAAIDLAVGGVAVTLFESASVPGGRMREIVVDGQGIDSGPTVFTMRWVFEELFAAAGRDLGAEVDLIKADVLARHSWADGSRLDREAIVLFIDNEDPDFRVSTVEMGTQTGGACALFCLSSEPVPAPLEVRFKAVQNQGFLQHYTLKVRKGNIGQVAITTTTGPMGEVSGLLSQTYAHGSASPCNQLFGTRVPDEPQADPVTDYVTAYVIPQKGWAGSSQLPVCGIT